MGRNSTTILIADYIASLNKGELELLIGVLKTFDFLGHTNVDIFSFYPDLEAKRYPECIRQIDVCKDLHVERYVRKGSPNSILLASLLSGFQHILFVGLYKLFKRNALSVMKKPIWHAYCFANVFITCLDEADCVNGSLLKLNPVYISLLAKTLSKTIVVYANSNTKTTNTIWLWRFNSRKFWEILARYFLNNVDLITLRDQQTLDYYESLVKNTKKLYLTGDPGVLMDPADPQIVRGIMEREKIEKSDGLLVGAEMTQRLLLHSSPEIPRVRERYEKAISEIAKVLDKLIIEYKATIVFIPHCIEYYRDNDDRDVANDIFKKMKNKSNVKVITNEYTAEELKGLLGQFDVLISDRIHALISALSMNVPCCTLAYRSDKRPFNMIGKDFEQEKWIYEVDALNADELYKFLTEILIASEEIRKSLPSLTQHAKERALLNGQLLKTLLKSKRNSPQ